MSALAATLGMTNADLSEYRYKPGHTGNESIYLVGDDYFCAKKTTPKYDAGATWVKNRDQFFAERAGTIIWRATPSSEAT